MLDVRQVISLEQFFSLLRQREKGMGKDCHGPSKLKNIRCSQSAPGTRAEP